VEDDMNQVTIKTALISVSDKTGLEELGKLLTEMGVNILSTGGTYKLLADAGCSVKEVSDHTGFPEMMDGRVKTLHPLIHGGLLGRAGIDDEVMAAHGITAIDLVIVNLYPFEATVASGADHATVIENIDIGGPAMVRSAAKNYSRVLTVVDPADYRQLMKDLTANDGRVDEAERFRCAKKAFEHVSRYDGAISNYLGAVNLESNDRKRFPDTYTIQVERVQEMRYGENPHQQAAFYVEPGERDASVSTSTQLQGKALSYNNVADTDAALECVKVFEEAACVIVKHANPCGVAVAGNLLDAYNLAFATDTSAAFGGIIAFNRELDEETARTIVDRQFVEVIVAPSVTDGAQQAVANKKNVRLLACGELSAGTQSALDFKRVSGGLLLQDRDQGMVTAADLNTVSQRAPTEQEIKDLLFAWKVAKFVKSNAIVYARDNRTIGIGAGQMARVHSARIAGMKAADENLEIAGSVMASDAFFPFRDSIDAAAEAGIRAIIQPGGSIRDDEVIKAADEAGIAMVFTGMRHFRH